KLAFELARTENGSQLIWAYANRSGLSLCYTNSGIPEDFPDLAFQTTHAGLARIRVNDFAQCIVRDFDLTLFDTVGFHLPANEIASRNLQFFGLGVAGQTDDLHAVAQRTRDAIEHVRGGDEHHTAQI